MIARHADMFKPGEYIFRENEPADKFFIISQGKVNIETQVPGRHPFFIQTMPSGDILGEIYKRLAGIFVQRREAARPQLVQVYSYS